MAVHFAAVQDSVWKELLVQLIVRPLLLPRDKVPAVDSYLRQNCSTPD